jgi:hypothetical protein
MPPRNRKHRSDRNHVVYRLTCIPTGEVYFGLTVARGRGFKKSMMIRWKHHVRNALKYEKKTILYDRIREHGPEAWKFEVVEVVRGKQPAHDLELSLIKDAVRALNMEGLGRKKKRVSAA